MANPGDFAYIVKQQADIVRIVGEYVKLRQSGAQDYSGRTFSPRITDTLFSSARIIIRELPVRRHRCQGSPAGDQALI
jgi:hypothetical protein